MFHLSKEDLKKIDYVSIVIMMVLLAVGLYCIRQADLSSGDPLGLYKKQLLGIGIGTVAMVGILCIDYRKICDFAIFLYIGIVGLLAYTLKFGDTLNSVTRWVTIAGVQLQPSELAKLVLIISLAYMCSLLQDRMDRISTLFILGAVIVIPIILILMQPHLSTCMVIVFIFGIMVYTSGISYKVIACVLAVAIPVAASIIIAVGVYHVELPFIKEYQVNRILSFFSDDEDESQDGQYQQTQAVLAVGAGGQNGKLVSSESEIRGYSGIYANESDFIFSVVGEELGFIGSTLVIFLYFIIVVRCLITAKQAADETGRMICIGVSAMFLFQVFVNIGVATNILPNTGLPLPFISYGLTSLVSSMSAIALVLSIGIRRVRK